MAWVNVNSEGEVDTLRIITEKKQLKGANNRLIRCLKSYRGQKSWLKTDFTVSISLIGC